MDAAADAAAHPDYQSTGARCVETELLQKQMDQYCAAHLSDSDRGTAVVCRQSGKGRRCVPRQLADCRGSPARGVLCGVDSISARKGKSVFADFRHRAGRAALSDRGGTVPEQLAGDCSVSGVRRPSRRHHRSALQSARLNFLDKTEYDSIIGKAVWHQAAFLMKKSRNFFRMSKKTCGMVSNMV